MCEEYETLKRKFDETETDLKEKTELLNAVSQDKVKMESTLIATEGNLSRVSQENEDLKQQVNALREAVDGKKDEAHDKQVKLKEKEVQLSHRDKEANEKAQLLEKKESEYAEAYKKHEIKTEELEKMNKEMQHVATSLKYESEDRAELKKWKKEFELEVSKNKNELDKLREEFDKMREEKINLEAEIASLRDYKQKATRDELQLKEQLEAAHAKEEELQKENDDLLNKVTKSEEEWKDQSGIPARVITHDGLSEDWRNRIVDMVAIGTLKNHEFKAIASYVRNECQRQYGGGLWQCIVGLTHQSSVWCYENQRIILEKGKLKITVFRINPSGSDHRQHDL